MSRPEDRTLPFKRWRWHGRDQSEPRPSRGSTRAEASGETAPASAPAYEAQKERSEPRPPSVNASGISDARMIRRTADTRSDAWAAVPAKQSVSKHQTPALNSRGFVLDGVAFGQRWVPRARQQCGGAGLGSSAHWTAGFAEICRLPRRPCPKRMARLGVPAGLTRNLRDSPADGAGSVPGLAWRNSGCH
jgi:hypothetical protein